MQREGYILNPATNRYVKIDGAIGKKLLRQAKPEPEAKAKRREEAPLQDPRFTLVNFGKTSRPTKVLFADLDHTLITPKGKNVFPKSIDDWKWKENVVSKLREMSKEGYEIVIVTNQKKMSPDEVRQKAKLLHDDIKLPFVLLAGHDDLYYRKPQLGLWEVLQKYILKGVSVGQNSVFIGDSVTDLHFARNVGLTFVHTDKFFLNKDTLWNEKDEHPLLKHVSETTHNQLALILPEVQKHLVVMVGAPASGKSYYSKELEKRGFVRINRDDMKTDKVMQVAFDKAITEGKNIVIDNTNPTMEGRLKWIGAARKASYRVKIVWLNFPLQVAEFLDSYRIAQDKDEKAHVPAVGMRVYYKKLEPPSKKECDDLVEIKHIDSQIGKKMLAFWA